MSWGRVDNPKKIFKVGDTVKAFIKDINGDKIALSLKFDETNPWLNAEEKYAVGTIVEGTIARMTDFGAFVELEPGVDALLHVSQISYEHVAKPEDVFKIGQKIEAKVVDFKPEEKKISLSVKALLPVPEETAEPAEEVAEETVSEEAAPAARLKCYICKKYRRCSRYGQWFQIRLSFKILCKCVVWRSNSKCILFFKCFFIHYFHSKLSPFLLYLL